jgi:hypothetical protein
MQLGKQEDALQKLRELAEDKGATLLIRQMADKLLEGRNEIGVGDASHK